MSKHQNSSLRLTIASAAIILAISPTLPAAAQPSTANDAFASVFSFANFLSEILAEIWPEDSQGSETPESVNERSGTDSEIEIEPPKRLAAPTSESQNPEMVP